MRDACKRAVSAALGRELRPEEVRDIETRINRHMRLLAQRDPRGWSALPEEERLNNAGEMAARELVAEAQRKKDNLARRAVRLGALQDFIEGQVAAGQDATRIDAFHRILAPKADAGGVPEGGSIDQRAQGIYADAVRALADVFEAGQPRGLWRFLPFNDPQIDRAMRRALAGDKGVPARFVQMARTAHEYIDLLRRRFNAAGGAIGRLEDWGEPHRWSDVRLVREIKRRGRAAVVGDFVKAANRARYFREDGSRMSEAEIGAFMDSALQSIMTDGASERLADPAAPFAQAIAANRHRAHREIHLRPDAVEPMLRQYSELGAMESLVQHIRTLARDIALIETFGPNAELSATQLMERAFNQDVSALPARKSELTSKRDHAQYLYDYLAGNVRGQRNALNASMSFLRSWAVFKSLGFTVWSSLTDPVIMLHVAKARGLSAGRLWINDVAQFAGQGRRWAIRAGLITDTVVGFADRLSYDHLNAPDIGARAASFTLRVTGLNYVTEARRAAYGLTMMDAIGHLVRNNKRPGTVKNADDRGLLRLLNVTDEAWAVWRMAPLERRGLNATVLSPQAIAAIDDAALARAFPERDPALLKQEAITQLLGIIKDENNTAVTTAGSRERAAMLGDQTKSGAGTIGGELRRAVVLFRSFPWTYMTRQWELAKSIDGGGNRFAYAGSLIASTWAMGIIVNWTYDILNGRDPGAIDPDSEEGRRNLIAGLMRGGGLGIFGDFLFANADPGMRNQSIAAQMTGPVFSQLDDVQQLTLGNLNQAAAGQETNAGPEAVAFVQRQLTPNWWYSRALLDRYVFNALQEELEPGYNARRSRRQFSTRGTTYWLPADPDEKARAPDWTRALEGDMPERMH